MKMKKSVTWSAVRDSVRLKSSSTGTPGYGEPPRVKISHSRTPNDHLGPQDNMAASGQHGRLRTTWPPSAEAPPSSITPLSKEETHTSL
ncbi:hypothetical protein EYF80_033428 [Liparis tanakae]|uniref:Uncharacterized protein n=1 Tax=Liparis tanakae TaxID=230148 RepID=A0A4Z2GRX4_9TELE|nr:hypothetical protein EYF80_033428 [Liparis tanakae]